MACQFSQHNKKQTQLFSFFFYKLTFLLHVFSWNGHLGIESVVTISPDILLPAFSIFCRGQVAVSIIGLSISLCSSRITDALKPSAEISHLVLINVSTQLNSTGPHALSGMHFFLAHTVASNETWFHLQTLVGFISFTM